jgi:hypothetical protein
MLLDLVILSQQKKLFKFLKPIEYVKKIARWRDSRKILQFSLLQILKGV